MTHVGAHRARANLSELLDRVEAGEEIVITRRGRPVARLVAPEESGASDIEEIASRLRAYRDRHPLGIELTLHQLLRDGRGG